MQLLRGLTAPSRLSLVTLVALSLVVLRADAQSQTPVSATPTSRPPITLGLSTTSPTPTLPISLVTSVYLTRVGGSSTVDSAARPTPTQGGQGSIVLTTQVFTSTLSGPLPTSTFLSPDGGTNSTGHHHGSASGGLDSLPLETKLNAVWATLGVLLIISGGYHAFVGYRIRWTMYGLTGFYWFAITTVSLVLLLGVQRQVNDPSLGTQGLFLFASFCGGALGSLLFIIFNDAGDELAAALGGLVLGLFIQALKQDGVIRLPGFRWILYSALAVIFAGLARWKRSRTLTITASTSIVGATALILGIDCFSRVGLKELYARNLGFDANFADRHVPTFADHRWPLVVPLQIELGVLGGVTLMAMALQSTTWAEICQNFRALRNGDDDRRLKAQASRAAKSVVSSAKKDLKQFEKRRSRAAAQSMSISSSGQAFNAEHDIEKHAGRFGHADAAGAPSLPQLERRHTRGTARGSESDQADAAAYDFGILPLPALATSMGALSDRSSAPTSVGTPKDEDKKELTEGLDLAGKFALLDEIETIRKTIRELKTSEEGKGAQSSYTLASDARARRLSTIDFRAPLESSSVLALDTPSDFSPAAPKKAAPWMTSERRRDSYFGGVHAAASMSGSGGSSTDAGERRSRSQSQSHGPTSLLSPWASQIDHGRAASDQPQWDNHSTAPSAPIRAVSMYLESTPEGLSNDDVPSSQAGGLTPPKAAAVPLPSPNSSVARRSRQRPDLGSYRHSYAAGQSALFAPPQLPTATQRTIVDTPDAANVRYQAALPGGGPKRMSTVGFPAPDVSEAIKTERRRYSQMLPSEHARPQSQQRIEERKDKAMTMHELQARHRARLSALQAPVTQKMTDEVRLDQAREQWKRKVAADKRAWEERLRAKEAELKALEERKRIATAGNSNGAGSSRNPVNEWRRSIIADLDPVTRDRATKAAQRSAHRQSLVVP